MGTPSRQLDEPPRYIAIEGPIGVGKTTLAQRLAESLHYPTLLEPSAENPFLDRFYRERGRNALPTQLYFLLHRVRQLADLTHGELFGTTVVSDFLLAKDRLFAELTLDADELVLYQQIYDKLAVAPPAPDLVVYLQAPTSVLHERIRRRGVPAEQYIASEYLDSLIDAYTRFFHYYDEAPLLIVNAAEIDFANNDEHYHELLTRVLGMNGARQYFNPNPTLI
jgi:deoxyadenosine/deoxycytidine kinase